MTSKEQMAEQISAENRAADARITMRRGGGQSEPTTPSGTWKMWKPPTRGATPPIEKNLNSHNRPTTRHENLGAATSTAGFLYRYQRFPSFYGLPRPRAFLPKAESAARRQAAAPCGHHLI